MVLNDMLSDWMASVSLILYINHSCITGPQLLVSVRFVSRSPLRLAVLKLLLHFNITSDGRWSKRMGMGLSWSQFTLVYRDIKLASYP